ncbi:hypothetical protein F4780DRAFT_685334 [Xylariomycetidae sp. FL0641]|nr:hypothetical protein F4780DRAFT_685334 [Xylariomycetidae sp. FL0641]
MVKYKAIQLFVEEEEEEEEEREEEKKIEGPLECHLPENFFSISKLNKVPDNQEVFVERDSLTTIIFDILERVTSKDVERQLRKDDPGHAPEAAKDVVMKSRFHEFGQGIVESLKNAGADVAPNSATWFDAHALLVHLTDIVGEEMLMDGKGIVKIWNTAITSFSHKEVKDVPAYTLIATHKPPTPPKSKDDGPDFVSIIMTLLRLKRVETDIVIAVNVPFFKGEYDEADVDLANGRQGKLIGDAVTYSAKIWETFHIRDWGLFKGV